MGRGEKCDIGGFTDHKVVSLEDREDGSGKGADVVGLEEDLEEAVAVERGKGDQRFGQEVVDDRESCLVVERLQ